MEKALNRFLGDSLLRVVLKLLVASLLVGWLMSIFGWTPLGIWYAIEGAVLELWYSGFAALGRFGRYILLGAAVVVPIFILIRLFSYRRT
ncbi:MAG: DUF6460 domain-containing protein [Rhizobiaceae bacterium]|nr:DUF6460 domain-containing protein [Rhizobiaceae bacterium]MCV0405909.1 DUF6460 domain-containing protein [Rhizobiaceae bacterium]